MKNKYFLWTVFLIILFIFFIMPVFADDEETEDNMLDEVYIGGKIGSSGSTRGSMENPVKTFAEAFEIVKNGGTIAMLNNTKWKDSDKKAMEESDIDFITIDGKGNGKRRYKIEYELQNTTPRPIMFATCKGITLTNVESEGTIYARGSPLVIKGESKLAAVYGGSRELDVIEGNTSITLESGEVSNIYGGSLVGKVKGNAIINIKGGTVKDDIISAGNTTKKEATFVTGDSTINIIGGVNFKSKIISTNCTNGAVGGVRTINIIDSKVEVEKICDANELNIINSVVKAKIFELANNISLIENINIDKESTIIANSGNEYRIKGELSGNGKLILNNESFLGVKEVDENAEIKIKTNKPYYDDEGNLFDLLIQASEELVDVNCFVLEKDYKDDEPEKKYILVNGKDNENVNSIYIQEAPDEDPDKDPDEDPDKNPDKDPDKDPDEDPDKDPDEDSDKDSSIGKSDNEKKSSVTKNSKAKSTVNKHEDNNVKEYIQIHEESEEGSIVEVKIGNINENSLKSIVMAIPKPGHVFISWSDGITFPIRQSINSENTVIKANFKKKDELEDTKITKQNNLNFANNGQKAIISVTVILSSLLNYIF